VLGGERFCIPYSRSDQAFEERKRSHILQELSQARQRRDFRCHVLNTFATGCIGLPVPIPVAGKGVWCVTKTRLS
jgi:hypothetical protein